MFKSTSISAKLLGPTVKASELDRLGGHYAKWKSNFIAAETMRFKADGVGWANANYYDRAKIYYQWYAATGNLLYLERGHAVAYDYLTKYVPVVKQPDGTWIGGGVSSEWSMPIGVAIYNDIKKDEMSRAWLLAVANRFATPYMRSQLGLIDGEMDNRIQARYIEICLIAWLLTQEAKWATYLREALTKIKATQSADGAYRFKMVQGGNNKPFMVGLLNTALMRYYTLFERDVRIPPMIATSVDYMWRSNWLPPKRAFEYMDNQPASNDDAPDLNNLIVNGFAFAGQLAQSREIFGGAVDLGWLGSTAFGTGSKQFNQCYSDAMWAVFLMNTDAALAWTDVAPAPQPDPVPTPTPNPANAEATLLMLEAKAKIDAALKILAG